MKADFPSLQESLPLPEALKPEFCPYSSHGDVLDPNKLRFQLRLTIIKKHHDDFVMPQLLVENVAQTSCLQAGCLRYPTGN